jgi:hypothetical protein
MELDESQVQAASSLARFTTLESCNAMEEALSVFVRPFYVVILGSIYTIGSPTSVKAHSLLINLMTSTQAAVRQSALCLP